MSQHPFAEHEAPIADSDKPPILQSWSRIYVAVIAFLVLQIILYSIITELLK